MPNVLIRDVPPEDLEEIRMEAAERGVSLQSFLLAAVHAQAVYLRRQAAIVRTAQRLRDQAEVPESERDAVLAAVDLAHGERAKRLSGRPVR